MAFGTIVHLHAVPGIFFETGDALSPDVSAVTGDSVFFINRKLGGLTDMSVAGSAIHLGCVHMSGMGEKNARGLFGINQPGNLLTGGDIPGDEFFFLGVCTVNAGVAVDAFGKPGGPGEAAVLPEIMAAPAAFFDQLHVEGMIEIDRLSFLGVKKFRKGDPADDQADRKSDDEKKKYGAAGPVSFFRGFRIGAVSGACGSDILWCAHENSVMVKLIQNINGLKFKGNTISNGQEECQGKITLFSNSRRFEIVAR
jgi:hypothetical protein